MNYARLLLISKIFFIFLAGSAAVVISQSSTREVGTPMCETYYEQSGVHCARVRCDATGYNLPAQGTNPNCTPTHPADQTQLHCESAGGPNCEVSDPVSCNPGNRIASFGRACTNPNDDTIHIQTVESPAITCPVTCPGCPTPSGSKPCRRAVWNTTYCKWDRTPCDTAGGGDGGGWCRSGYTTSGEKVTKEMENDPASICSPCNPDPTEVTMCQQGGGTYDWGSCQCGQSPIVIDVDGDGFDLTDAAGGVRFDINGDGTQEQIAWSANNSDEAWLALDRDGNNLIDSGKELFGNSTPQPNAPAGQVKNGFLALAVFDKTANGGNNDGKITAADDVFMNLRLWRDANHNGISEAGELKTLNQLGLARIDLDYKESRKTDDHGNRFRFRAKVRDAQNADLGRWAWDVYLVVQPNN
jgi:hypothetical protein